MADEFKVHRLNAVGFAKAVAIADAFRGLLEIAEVSIPKGRELALVITKLQEACFFTKRAIALQPENCEP